MKLIIQSPQRFAYAAWVLVGMALGAMAAFVAWAVRP